MWWERRGQSLAPLYCLLAVCAAGIVTGCTNLEATAPSVARIPSPGNTAQLNHGRELYLGKCTACHVAEPVAKYSAAKWPGIIREMSIESKLSPAEEQAVLAYVMAALRAPAVKLGGGNTFNSQGPTLNAQLQAHGEAGVLAEDALRVG